MRQYVKSDIALFVRFFMKNKDNSYKKIIENQKKLFICNNNFGLCRNAFSTK